METDRDKQKGTSLSAAKNVSFKQDLVENGTKTVSKKNVPTTPTKGGLKKHVEAT